MDYEKNKDALAIVKQMVADGHVAQDVAEKYFPELAESEDERIRKGLLYVIEHHPTLPTEEAEEYIAWLEKQGEQKPFDKVEPKFKIGDWVIDKQGIVHQIANVIENVTYHTYGYDIVGGGYFNDNTEGVRLWTIQDAKDGDVLADNVGVILFRKIGNERFADAVDYHCAVFSSGEFNIQKGLKFWGESKEEQLRPATKEQRDLLFQKMHEAGYEWDAEKKELKKIEQTSDWSEEEQVRINRIVACLENQNVADNDILLKDVDWLKNKLKSLRPQNTWKPSDEQIGALEHFVRSVG